MGSVYRRKDGRWVAQYREGGRRITIYANSMREAEQKMYAVRGAPPESVAPIGSVYRHTDGRRWRAAWNDGSWHRVTVATAAAAHAVLRRVRDGKPPLPERTRPSIGPRLRFSILARDDYTCRYCGRSAPEVELHVDHVVPRSAGGSDDPDNLASSCADCNLGKSDKIF